MDAYVCTAETPRRWPLRRARPARVRSLRGPAADPRRGDGAPCGAPAPRGAGAGARAAAGAARPRRLIHGRSRPPPARPPPSVRGPGGAGSGPHLTDLPSPCRVLRRALHSAHRNDATPGRTPGRAAGARNGVFTAYVPAASSGSRLIGVGAREAARVCYENDMRISREELYEQVWADPMTTVAARYDVSFVWLRLAAWDS